MNFTLGKCSPAVIGGENAILHNFTFVNGKKFPPSYVSFVRQYGYGLSCGLFIIYIPMGDYPDSFFCQKSGDHFDISRCIRQQGGIMV